MEKTLFPPPPPNAEKNVNSNISQLPQDLKTHIYQQHLWFDVEKKPECNMILDWFQKSEEAQRLILNEDIVKRVESLLKNKTCIEYLRKHDNDFNRNYDYHYIQNRKHFVLMDKLNSFVLSILMCKYH